MGRRLRPDHSDAGSLFEARAWLAMMLSTVTVAFLCVTILVLYTSALARRNGNAVRAIPEFVAARDVVASAHHVELWRGLPRDATHVDPERHVLRVFGWFESTPIQPAPEDTQWLRDWCKEERHYDLRNEEDLSVCGGYHADWAVVFTSPERSTEFGLCFGCNEVKVTVGGQAALHLDLRDEFTWWAHFEPYRAR